MAIVEDSKNGVEGPTYNYTGDKGKMAIVEDSKNGVEGPTYNYTGDKGAIFGSRHKQIIAMAFGLSIVSATKYVMSLAIVAMTGSPSPNPDIPKYEWDNTNVILSSVLWSGVAVNLLAGYLGETYGPKWFFVVASLLNACFFTIIPLSAQLGGSIGVMICRIFQGFAMGFVTPLGAIIMTRWVPPEERSRMGFLNSGLLSVLVMMASVGTGFIGSSWLGWPWIFYIFGAINLIWVIFYTFFGYASPDMDKSISPAEKKYITESISVNFEKKTTPWKKMLLSMPFWAILIGQAGFGFMTVLLSTEITIYMAKVLKFDLKANAAIPILPAFVGLGSGIGLAILSDVIVKRKILSVVNTRRIFHIGGTVVIALSLILMTFIPIEYKTWTILLLCFGNIGVIAAGVGGVTPNIMDVSAKYAGVIVGCTTTLSEFVSIFAPLMVHWICNDEYDNVQWRTAFFINAALAIGSAIFYAVFTTDQQQNWDGEIDQPVELLHNARKLSIISLTTPGLGL